MMPELLVKMIVQSGVVHSQPDPKKWLEKGRIVGHRCGACHKAFNAKVRKIGKGNVKKLVFKS